MIKHCQTCGAEFTPTFAHPQQKYCSRRCQERSKAEHAKLKMWFEVEWQAWKRDFAAGKTQSNLRR